MQEHRPTPFALIVEDRPLAADSLLACVRDCDAGLEASPKLLAGVRGAGRSMLYSEAQELGAIGYLIKNTSIQILRDAIRAVIGGHRSKKRVAKERGGMLSRLLTPRQLRALEELAAGRSNKEIAVRLNVGDETMNFHMREILGRLAVRNRTEAVVRYFQIGNQADAGHPGKPV